LIDTGFRLAALVAAGFLLLLLAWHRPKWVVFAVLVAASLLDCLQVGVDGLDLGVNVYIDDVACAMMLGTGVLVLLRCRKGVPRDAIPCLLLMALIGLSFTRGVGSFGLKPAGNSARNLFAFTASALAIMLLRPVVHVDSARLARLLGCAGIALCAVAVLRWAGALPMPVAFEENFREVVRCLPSDHAIVVGQAFIAAVYLLIVDRRRGWWWWAAAGMFAVVTLALQHRSVWVATFAGAAWLAFRTGRRSPVRWLALGAAACVALCFVVVADPTLLGSASEMINTNVSETESANSTWAWRVQGYTEAADRVFAGAATDMLIGPPAGWAAHSDASFASTHIHSRYVDTLAYYGLAGVSLLLVWFAVLIHRSRGRGHTGSRIQLRSQNFPVLVQALLVSELVYLVPYFGGMLQGAVLGLLWISATQETFQPRTRRLAPAHFPEQCLVNSPVLAGQQ
jgi:hypothetical protein